MLRSSLVFISSLVTCMSFQAESFAQKVYETPRTQSQTVVTVSADVPPNFETAPDEEVAKVPILFYEYINHRQYKKALSLLTPHTRDAYAGISLTEYLHNIKHAEIEQFHDITAVWGGIPLDLSKYYKVKVYVAVVNFSVIDPKIAGIQIGRKIRRFFVVKTSKDAPWQLMMEQTMSLPFVSPSWNLDLSGVS